MNRWEESLKQKGECVNGDFKSICALTVNKLDNNTDHNQNSIRQLRASVHYTTSLKVKCSLSPFATVCPQGLSSLHKHMLAH